MESGLAHHGAGRLSTAADIYRQIIAVDATYADALHHLGLIEMSQGNLAAAIERMRQSVELAPRDTFYLVNLGAAYRKDGKLDEAAKCYEMALAIEPLHAGALTNLGNVRALKGQLDEAVSAYRKALSARGDMIEAWSGLAKALLRLGNAQEAEAAARRALELGPSTFEIHEVLGDVLSDLRKTDEAIESYRRAVAIRGDHASTLMHLGRELNRRNRVEEARAVLERALKVDPTLAEAYLHLGNAMKDQGQVKEAIETFKRAIELDPTQAWFGHNLLYTMHFDGDYDGPALLKEHVKWADAHERPLEVYVRGHENERSRDRRLRVGYVSADFRGHAVGRFLYPLMASHDRKQFEIVCFSDVAREDNVTAELRKHTDEWHETRQMSFEEQAEFIQSRRIDVLVDLALHMSGNRLLTFARKPAPVQVTYLAYAGTSGMRQMEYRITDPYLDPPGEERPFYTEKPVYLEKSYWCYAPVAGAPEVGELPARRNGFVTFGCLNNFCKLSQQILKPWGEILNRVSGSRLIVHAQEGKHRADFVRRLGTAAGDPAAMEGRVEFVGSQSPLEYLRTYNRIDIALDPFPYPGGTTSCDALWMGVPVVTLAGQTAVQRAGVSILSNIGMKQFIAGGVSEYIELAHRWASDLERLAAMRKELRGTMRQSPLTDARTFAAAMETAYREMWRRWCQTQA